MGLSDYRQQRGLELHVLPDSEDCAIRVHCGSGYRHNRLLWEVGPIAELVQAWGLLGGRSCVESQPGAGKQVGLKTGSRIIGIGWICCHHCKLLEHAIVIVVSLGLVGGNLLL
jgi:hypothetical protein